MDARSQHFARATGSGPGEAIPPFFWVVGQFVLGSGIASVALFGRIDVRPFAFAGLGVSMFLVASAVIVEFEEVVFSPEEPGIVGHRALDGRTWAAARLANLGAFVLVATAALNVFPAILGCFLRDSSAAFLPAYAFASLLANVSVVAAVSLVYAFCKRPSADPLRDILAWAQILLVLAAVYGAQWMFRDPDARILDFLASPPAWTAFLPAAWLADAVATAAVQGATAAGAQAAFLGLAVTSLLSAWLVLRVAASAPTLASASRGMPDAVIGSPVASFLGRVLGRGGVDAALVTFCARTLARDHDLRLRVLPSLVTIPVLAALGLATGQLGNAGGSAGGATLSLCLVVLVVAAVPTMLHAMSFSRHDESAWLLRTAPLTSPSQPAGAARRIVCWAVALPVLCSLTVLFAVAWRDPMSAVVTGLAGWLLVLAAGDGTEHVLKHAVPFGRSMARGDFAGGVAPWWAAVVTFAALAVAARAWAGADPIRIGLVLALLAVTALVARRVAR
jgi:hypothetical protein